jgi:hypothetical protein
MCRRIVGLSRTLKTEAPRPFETSWTIYRSTPLNIIEDVNLQHPEDGHISRWLLCHKSTFIQPRACVWLDVGAQYNLPVYSNRSERRETIQHWEKTLRADRQDDVSLFGMKLCKIGKCLCYFTERTQTLVYFFPYPNFLKQNPSTLSQFCLWLDGAWHSS